MFANNPFGTTGICANTAILGASTPVVFPAAIPADGFEARVVNIGTAPCFVRFDGTVPTVNNAMPLVPGVVEIFTFPGNYNFATLANAIAAAAGTSTVYVTLGRGN